MPLEEIYHHACYPYLRPVLGDPKRPSAIDIDSIHAVEAGLRAYDGALLVVSHDKAFLDAIGITRRVALTVPEEYYTEYNNILTPTIC